MLKPRSMREKRENRNLLLPPLGRAKLRESESDERQSRRMSLRRPMLPVQPEDIGSGRNAEVAAQDVVERPTVACLNCVLYFAHDRCERHQNDQNALSWKTWLGCEEHRLEAYATLVFRALERSLRTILEAIAVSQRWRRDGVMSPYAPSASEQEVSPRNVRMRRASSSGHSTGK